MTQKDQPKSRMPILKKSFDADTLLTLIKRLVALDTRWILNARGRSPNTDRHATLTGNLSLPLRSALYSSILHRGLTFPA